MCRRRSPSVMMPARRPSVVDDARHAEALARHLVDDVAHRRGRSRTDGHGVAGVHQLLDAHQPLAEPAARVQAGEVLLPEPLLARAAPSPARRPWPAPPSCWPSARGSAGTPPRRRRSRATTSAACAERGVRATRSSRSSRAPMRRMVSSSRSSSPVSPLCDSATTTSSPWIDAEVAVHGFGRVQEERRRARARQRRGDLAAMMPDLPMPVTMTRPRQSRSMSTAPVNRSSSAVDEREDRGGLGPEHLAGEFEVGHGRARHGARRAGPASMRVEQPRAAASRRSSASAFCASLFARAGSSWISRNTPSTPAATPAGASGSMYSRLAGRHAVAGARQLQAVRHVEDDRVAELAHASGTRACRPRGCCSRTWCRAR